MNKFITTDLGGLPFVLDDIRFQQDATREAFTGLLSKYGVDPNDIFIISGCEINDLGSVLSVDEGYMAIDGEILKVPAHTVIKATGLDKNYFEIVITYDPNGNKTFDSGSNFDTYEIREAKLVYNTFLPSTRVLWSETRRLNEWTTINLEGSTDVVVDSNLSGIGTEAALVTAPAAGSVLRYKIEGKTVHINFLLTGVEVPNYSTIEARSIKIKGLPFNFISDVEYGTYHATGTVGDLSGVNQVLHTGGTNELIFRLAHLGSNFGVFNRFYEFQAAPAMNVQTTADVSSTHIWSLTGSVTFIIN